MTSSPIRPPQDWGAGGAETSVYPARRHRAAAARDALTIRWNRIANARLLAFLVGVAALGWAFVERAVWPLPVAGAGFAAFVGLVVVHRWLGRERRRAAILHDVNAEAEARLQRDWDALPLRHAFRAAADHPYAADLDLFGRASLFHVLETVETPMGEERLRNWLLAPAPAPIVKARQAAVAELAPLLDWRQELQTRGRLAGEARLDPAPLLAWAEGEPILTHRRPLVWAARLGALGFLLTALLDLLVLSGPPLWLVVAVLNLALSQFGARGASERIIAAASRHEALVSYAGLLRHLSEPPFAASPLADVQRRLAAERTTAHEAIRRLHRLTAWAVPRSSIGYLPLQAIAALDVHVLDALERWQATFGRRIRDWLAALGEAEALAALAGLAHDEPTWGFPDLDPEADRVAARGLGHPLLPDGVRVVNDVTLGPPGNVLLVTGSNMSGKSTLLRALGVNMVLAGAGGPVCASTFHLPEFELWTSVRVQDSLERGVSFFMAELLRLKRIVDAARAADPAARRVVYLLDEILQGTNTAERQIAARRIVRGLVDLRAIGAVSTHDLDLANGPELADPARLVHFRDSVAETAEGPTMGFDYTLRPGLAPTTNALKLMEIVGFDFAAPAAAPPHPAPGTISPLS